MNFFNILTLFGGLAMFLYGMRLMGDGLKESSSGALKSIMEKVTQNFFKAFLLGVGVTALIQSSTATIVITSGLVAAGIISLRQSLGIVIGANVGTTVTGQIIRLLDINSDSAGWLQLFRPSTLAPVALIIGIVLIMGFSFNNSKSIGHIAIGFGILFSGLLNMTSAVDTLSETGMFDRLFTHLGSNPFLGYLTGAGVAFILQSSSATIGILQAFSAAGKLHFFEVYAVIVGVYLGDCVTTAIVCSIGAKAEAKRVGVVDILFNLCKSVTVLVVVNILKATGVLDPIWNMVVNSGSIANIHTIYNLGCAVLLIPTVPLLEKLSMRIVKDDDPEVKDNRYAELLEGLNPAFFNTPALALQGCYSVLKTMFVASRTNIQKAMGILDTYNEQMWKDIQEDESGIDMLADKLSNYLVQLSPHISTEPHVSILDQYYKLVTEFERLGDHAMNIGEAAYNMKESGISFSHKAQSELVVMDDLIENILSYTETAFEKRDIVAAKHIEPLEEVVDDMVEELRNRHLDRLRNGKCSIDVGVVFMNLLVDIERISDVCSNVGMSVVARVEPGLMGGSHDYISSLHAGDDHIFNNEYKVAHMEYFAKLDEASAKRKKPDGEETDIRPDKKAKQIETDIKTDKKVKQAETAKADKQTKSSQETRPDKQSKPSQTSKSDKQSKNTKTDKNDKSGKQNKNVKSDKSGKGSKSSKSGKNPKSGK